MRNKPALLGMVFLLPCFVAADTRSYDYTYDFWGVPVDTIPAFTVERVIDRSIMPQGANISGIDDVCSGGGKIFLIDSAESRLTVVNAQFEFAASVKLLYDKDNRIALTQAGRQIILTNPQGVFFHEKTNELYIADTGAERILVLDGDKYFLKRVITRPANMTGVTKFEPSKIALDKANRIYVVVQSGFEGIIELTEDGSFSRYFGVNKPVVNLIEYFWKTFSTNEQREKMAKTFAPSFNNIAVDSDGFIYATTFDANSQDTVFRLNPKGENVLIMPVQTTIKKPIGDTDPRITNQFIDIAINDYGVYAVLDRVTGRIFLNNFYGELMSIINIPPSVKGGLVSPAAVTWFGDYLIAADKQLSAAYVYALTDFGRAAFGSARHYYNGEWKKSAEALEETLRLNSNYDLAYSGIGKYYLMEGDYKQAMYYLKLGQNREYYSKAFNYYRNQWVKDHFIWIALLFLAGAAALIYTEIVHHKKGGENGAAA
ncbi:hypothetical protein FACS189461_2250 [Spirochaetia bacterium]|nr:hypothetical protein FACS189461_2250 [Spirochaetia bacterium]